MKKRIVSLALTLAMLIGLVSAVPMTAAAGTVIGFEDGRLNGFAPRGDDGRDTSKLTVTTEAAHSGKHALLVTGRSHGWNGPSLQVAEYITPGLPCDISVWVLPKSPDSAQFMLSTQYKQGGSEKYVNIDVQTVTKAGGWAELKGQFIYTSDVDLSDVTIYVETGNANTEFYIDDVSFKGSEPYIPKEGIVWEASNGIGRHADTIAGYDYELWSQDGTGKAVMTVTGDAVYGGTFDAFWDKTLNVLFRSGKKFTDADGMDLANPSQKGKPHDEIGRMSIDFETSVFNTGDDLALVSVYGWAYFKTAPAVTHDGKPHPFSDLIEYYIVQTRGDYHPGWGGTKRGEAVIDGIEYEFFETDRIGEHALTGSSVNFKQYWSIPKSAAGHRTSGIISVSEHFEEWAQLGMVMDGPFYEVAMKIESYTGGHDGRGTASVTKNILKIDGDEPEPPKPVEAPNLKTADSWAHDHINEGYAKGFIPIALQNNYKANITRAEFVTLAMSWLRYNTGLTTDQLVAQHAVEPNRTFSDTTNTDILAAGKLDITAGAGGGRFGVNDTFSRQQAAVMLTKVYRILGEDDANAPEFGFADIGKAEDWAKNAINYVKSKGVMNGVGDGTSFDPLGTFTRQQSIIVFNQMG